MKRILIISVFFMCFLGCEEFYIPDISEQNISLVMEGLITDQQGEHYVNITKSIGYNDTSGFTNAGGFVVLIQEKGGEVFSLTECGEGRYVTNPDVKGQVNHEYRVIATSSSGRTYISSYVTLLPGAEIDSMKGEYHQETKFVNIENLGYVEKVVEGVQILNNTSILGFTPYYRYEYDVVYQSFQVYKTYPWQTNCYVARPYSSTSSAFVAILNGNSYFGNKIINDPVEFIQRGWMEVKITIDSLEFDSSGNEMPYNSSIVTRQKGFLLRLKQYSLNEGGFLFWDAINDQINATGQLFDPVETQIRGNISCPDDTTEVVFGYFGASAVTSKSQFFYQKSSNEIVTIPVDNFPELDSNIWSTNKFDFWVKY